jgi:hypothetical protein
MVPYHAKVCNMATNKIYPIQDNFDHDNPMLSHLQSELRRFPSVETRIIGLSHTYTSVKCEENDRISVAALIRAKIATEWDAGGAVGRESAAPDSLGAAEEERCPTLEFATRAAIDAYRAGWYVILVDGAPTTGLDQRLDLSRDSSVSFVRMCPLPHRVDG